jgi:hypothetical protein
MAKEEGKALAEGVSVGYIAHTPCGLHPRLGHLITLTIFTAVFFLLL